MAFAQPSNLTDQKERFDGSKRKITFMRVHQREQDPRVLSGKTTDTSTTCLLVNMFTVTGRHGLAGSHATRPQNRQIRRRENNKIGRNLPKKKVTTRTKCLLREKKKKGSVVVVTVPRPMQSHPEHAGTRLTSPACLLCIDFFKPPRLLSARSKRPDGDNSTCSNIRPSGESADGN